MIALDASALLALLLEEPGHERVYAWMPDACMSTVNLAEVLSRLGRSGHDVGERERELRAVGIAIVPFTLDHARRVAELAPLTRAAGLSLGGRACLALALERGVPAATADRTWADLDLPVRVEIVR